MNLYYKALDYPYGNKEFKYPHELIKVNTNVTACCIIFEKETNKEIAQISYDLRGNEFLELVDLYVHEKYDCKQILKWFNNEHENMIIDFSNQENNEYLISLGGICSGYIDDNYGYIYKFDRNLIITEEDLDFFR